MKGKEFKRQLFHAILTLIILGLLYYKIINTFHLFIVLSIGIIISFICLKKELPVISWFIKHFERKGEHPGKGAICLLVGIILAMKLFPEDIAFASIAILALGDSVSHYLGRFYGKTKHPLNNRKFIEGSIIGTLLAFLGAWIFVPALQAFAAAFIAMIAEAMEIEFNNRLMDDNISIPLVAGVTITLIRKFIPI